MSGAKGDVVSAQDDTTTSPRVETNASKIHLALYQPFHTETVTVLAIPGSITSAETLGPSNSKLSATCINLAVIYTDIYELRRRQRENAKPRSSSGKEVRCPSMHRSNKRCFSTPIKACSAAYLSLGKGGPGEI